MPHYQVEYSYDVPEYEIINVEAMNLEDVPRAVEALVGDKIFIESIEEIKNVA